MSESQDNSSSSQELRDRASYVESVLDEIRDTLARVRASVQQVQEYLNGFGRAAGQ